MATFTGKGKSSCAGWRVMKQERNSGVSPGDAGHGGSGDSREKAAREPAPLGVAVGVAP